MPEPDPGPEPVAETETRPEPVEAAHFHRPLVAIDGSEGSEMVIAMAAAAAEKFNAAVTLLTIVPNMAAESIRWPAAPMSPAQMQQDADTAGEHVIRQAVDRLDFPVHTVMRKGKPGPEIVAEAERGDYDVILIGARGIGRVHALFGSVSRHVLHHSPIPVVVAHLPGC